MAGISLQYIAISIFVCIVAYAISAFVVREIMRKSQGGATNRGRNGGASAAGVFDKAARAQVADFVLQHCDDAICIADAYGQIDFLNETGGGEEFSWLFAHGRVVNDDVLSLMQELARGAQVNETGAMQGSAGGGVRISVIGDAQKLRGDAATDSLSTGEILDDKDWPESSVTATEALDGVTAAGVSGEVSVGFSGDGLSGARDIKLRQVLHGSQRVMRVRLLSLRACGFADKCAILARDISEQNQLDVMQRDLISNISHELKTPVGAIGLLAETLADANNDAEAVQYFSSRILRESRRLQDLVAQILDISRSSSQRAESNLSANVGDSSVSADAGIDVYYGTAGGVDVLAESGESAPLGGNVEHSNSVLSNVDACNCKEVVGEVCNAVQVIQQAIDDSAVQAQAKHIHVAFTCVEDGHSVGLRRTADDMGQYIAGRYIDELDNVDDGSCRWIVAIRAQDLRTIVANIVNNAIAYSAPYTTVSVSVESDTEKYGDCIAIRVVDLGDGIPKEDTMRVFERFYRVDPARSRNTGGSGLGLAIVKQLVEQARGRVDLWSRLGEGTTVTVLLPCAV